MGRRLWWKSTLLLLSGGTVLSLGWGCLASTLQRVAVALAVG
jgi:hypothetical protein